jgi:energy-converting hydrogenase Eha subunit C
MKSIAMFGGIFGLLLFLVIGLLPALVYGGYAGVVLANGIIGGVIAESLLAKGIVIFTALATVLSVASIFTVAGAIGSIGIVSSLSTLGIVHEDVAKKIKSN